MGRSGDGKRNILWEWPVKCSNKEYRVLEGSAGRKITSNKNEAKQFKNGKQLTLKTAKNSRQ